jgi:hypothetical protein
LADEISERLCNGPNEIWLDTPSGVNRITTLQELRDALAPFGLEVVTKDAVEWGTTYPHAAENITKICELTQQADELAAIVAVEKKNAAE